MIRLNLTVKGEPDLSPFTTNIQCSSKEDEQIFANQVAIIQDKLARNLRININESITVYCAFVLSELRNGRQIEQIQKDALLLLRPDQVMIGVPETMRKISFEVALDGITRKIDLESPIRISDYIIRSG